MIAPGTILDNRYEILSALGAGGMGQVYRARRTQLGDEVALKVMRTTFGPDEQAELRQRFFRESRACAQLRDPHIVSILDFNVDPTGQPYMVMELLNGPSLRDEIELHGPMSPAAVVGILQPVAAALQLAHDRGITHRDLKPANIVSHRYESGERVYKVIDFGLASIQEQTDVTRLTEPNVFLGTLAYAAPEQLNGEPADARTDVYALGMIAYEMLAGRRAFEGSAGITLIQQTLMVNPNAPGMHRAGLSADIDAVVMRALEKDRAARWPSVTEFVRALERAAGLGAAAASATPREDALLARYELGEVLGRGRLGSLVYRGRHRALGIDVAIRILRREEQPNWGVVHDRFLMEARTLQVTHPNLLHVRDFGEDDRLVFLVTDFVDGPSLRQEITRLGRFPWARAARLLAQMLDATAALNARGGYVVGVNPDMIRLTGTHDQERAVMSTAGIDSVQDVLKTMREQELRGAEANEQELPFVPPEILMGQGPSPAADVFTVGVLAYSMTTGTLPYLAPSVPELLGQMLTSTPAPPRSCHEEVPEAASQAILRAIAGQTNRRFQTPVEFRQRLLA
jgi:serine/threonine protein kinase